MMAARTFADSVGSKFASCSIESAGPAAVGMSQGRDTSGAAAVCSGMLAAAAMRGSPRRPFDRGADRGSIGTVSGADPARLAGPGWEVGVYMISPPCAVAEGRGEPLMRSGADGGTPADASVRPCMRVYR